MNDQVMITKGESIGMCGKYMGKALVDGKLWYRIEMDYMYDVLFEPESVMFLHNGENNPEAERDESYNGQRFYNYQMLKENKD